jgi:hypothetical protein
MSLALFSDFDDRFAPVGTAFRANSVDNMVFTTVFANYQMIKRQRIMRTAFTAACAGMSAFRQRPHEIFSSIFSFRSKRIIKTARN